MSRPRDLERGYPEGQVRGASFEGKRWPVRERAQSWRKEKKEENQGTRWEAFANFL
jgi:hypothetical protein